MNSTVARLLTLVDASDQIECGEIKTPRCQDFTTFIRLTAVLTRDSARRWHESNLKSNSRQFPVIGMHRDLDEIY